MKKLLLILVIMLFVNIPVYALESDDYETWRQDYNYIDSVNGGQTYVCTKDYELNDNIYYVVDANGNVLFKKKGHLRGTDDVNRYIVTFEESESGEKYDYIVDKTGATVYNNDNKYSSLFKIKGINAYIAYAGPASEDLIKAGIIDDNGNILLPFFDCNYIDEDSDYCSEFLEFKNSENSIIGLIDKDDFSKKIIYSGPDYNEMYFKVINKDIIYGEKFILEENKTIISKFENGEFVPYKDTDWEFIEYYPDEDIITIKNLKNNKFGIVDKELNVVSEPVYYEDLYFKNGYAVAQYKTENEFNDRSISVCDGKFGAIDKNGNEVIKFEYDRIIRGENDNFICVKDKKKNIISLGKQMETPKCADWAKESVLSGNIYGIIPKELNCDFSKKLTREEFCKLAVLTFLKSDYQGGEAENYIHWNGIKNYFNDTNNKYVMIAHYKGIVNGKGNKKFCPNDTITRQEAAVMLSELVRSLRYTIDEKKTNFIDENYFADWAKKSIYKITNFKGKDGIPVMTGTGNGKFSPWYSYSREQAITTMVRIYDIVKHTLMSDYYYYTGKLNNK